MIFKSVSEWLLEQEHKKKPAVFFFEWLSIFVFAALFWAFLFHDLQTPIRSTAAAAAFSMLYACGFVYLRLFPLTKCKKCKSLLPLVREEVSRRRARDMETCLEIEHGGEEYWGHFIDLYYRIYHVDIVRFRCRRCHAIWDEMEQVPVANYKMIRRINVKD
ncbi:MAG TPA: hypothetical protein VLX61_03595 [Anaerolineales bacterium]|nr:hypothetical protein [Anaerolineales bacterium]